MNFLCEKTRAKEIQTIGFELLGNINIVRVYTHFCVDKFNLVKVDHQNFKVSKKRHGLNSSYSSVEKIQIAVLLSVFPFRLSESTSHKCNSQKELEYRDKCNLKLGFVRCG